MINTKKVNKVHELIENHCQQQVKITNDYTKSKKVKVPSTDVIKNE